MTLVGIALAITSCSSAKSDEARADSTPAASEPEHIHNLALVGDDLYMGTHNGMWKQSADGDVVRVSQDEWDVMGLSKTAAGWLAGGHPGPEQGGPTSLGLQKSGDGGQTWQPISLVGAVDFHRLAASGDVIVGISSSDGALMISPDGGRSWRTTTVVSLFDVVVDPMNPAIMVGTTQDGPVRSTDGGYTFAATPGAPLIALLAWSGDSLYGVTPDGAIYASVDGGATWDERGKASGAPLAFAADGESLAVLVGQEIDESADGGRTFTPRLNGVGQQ
ncbi:MAG: sialidase family protein [bacterium]|nr:sialidase family protein [bacterium]